jgi:hypothetical protein
VSIPFRQRCERYLADLGTATRRLPLYYAYAILKAGRVLVGGGEYVRSDFLANSGQNLMRAFDSRQSSSPSFYSNRMASQPLASASATPTISGDALGIRRRRAGGHQLSARPPEAQQPSPFLQGLQPFDNGTRDSKNDPFTPTFNVPNSIPAGHYESRSHERNRIKVC